MPKLKIGRRIMTFEEFMRHPRDKHEIATYHALLAAAQGLGWVDKDLNVVERVKARL